ncbi:MAG TPA: hypothetical protein PKD26_14595 [Pyrinomonadaceae bacterium]|nr:hypothetical protein [Pyrinomonadaceae bacterium]
MRFPKILFPILLSGILLVGLFLSTAQVVGSHAPGIVASPTPDEKAVGFKYRGFGIGDLAEEIRKKLGDPKDKSDRQDLYLFGDNESVQFIYGAESRVTAVMITFTGKLSSAPTPKDVFGVEVAPKPDGGIFKMVRYPKEGYWISYNKIVGDDSIISIAMQKL